MNLPEIIFSAVILLFIAAIIFVHAAEEYTGSKKAVNFILLVTGFISYYSIWTAVYLFFIKGILNKEFIPVLTLNIVFIIPFTGLLASVTLSKIKVIIRNFI